MRSGWLTVILLAATIVLALAVPTLRASFSERATQICSPTHGNYPSHGRLAEIVSEAPQDAKMHYAYALALWSELESSGYMISRPAEPLSADDVREAFGDAISLAPDDPSPRLSLAIFEMDQAGFKRLPQEQLCEDEEREEPTAEQRERVRRARELLDEVRSLDPDNAVPDYLLAWTWLADGDTDRALEAASRGAAKNHWKMYERQRVDALLALLDRTPASDEFTPMAAIALNASPTHVMGSRLRSVARAFRDMADDLRADGDHDAAIHIYETLLQAGHLMRTQARDLIDGLLAVALSAVTVSSEDWAPPNEQELLEADPDVERTRLRVEPFAQYLREHGRDDLAEFAETEIATGYRWKQTARELSEQMMNELVQDVSGGTTLHAGAIWATTAAMLLLAALVGLLSLLARYWREPRTQAGWSYLQWLGLLALLILPGQIGAYVARMRLVSHGSEAGNLVSSILGIGILTSVVAWLVGVLVLSLRKRWSLEQENRPGGPRSFLRGLRGLILPTLAALVLLCMPATYAIERNLERMGDNHRELATQGEVEYYGIDAGEQASGEDGPPTVGQR